jgi:deoxycytidylate deaminase
MENVVTNVYDLRQRFMIIGLTGRTGSGCSTVATLLKEGFEKMNPPLPSKIEEGVTNEERKYSIVYNYLKEKWCTPKDDDKAQEKQANGLKGFDFSVIKASDIIYFIALQLEYDKFIQAFNATDKNQNDKEKGDKEDVLTLDNDLIKEYNTAHNRVKDIINFLENKSYECIKESKDELYRKAVGYINFINNELPEIRRKIEKSGAEKLNVIHYLQNWGENIRRYGSIVTTEDHAEPEEPSKLARLINQIIKLIRKVNKIDNKPTFIIIDSLRNPFEVLYFRERYSAFYLMSITTSEDNRINNLIKRKFRIDEITKLDEKEYPSKRKEIKTSYYSQDVEKCVELSDIHITHDNSPVEQNRDLKKQLIHYIALILHPGLVQPTPQERLMQVAYTAKLNSGCISRLVGAVVTNSDYSVKSIGWNTVGKGQTPCSLRSFEDLYGIHDKSAFSKYELTDCDFRKTVDIFNKQYQDNKAPKKLNGVPLTYCFKDLYTYVRKGQKNQVHTRSLHAEENAFLQLAKYGSTGIDGGYLFTTASPCELCAKKAYQLGITKIFYIDIYPGISESHILSSGLHPVEMIQFRGAIGRAYQSLYEPMFPMKDEIEYLTGVEIKYNEDKSDDKVLKHQQDEELKKNNEN